MDISGVIQVRNDLLEEVASNTEQIGGRNPVSVVNNYSATVGPHGLTQRVSYTVPASKVYRLKWINLSVMRSGAAAPVSAAEIYVWHMSATPAFDGYMAHAVMNQNNFGDKDIVNMACDIPMLAGEQIRGYTIDASTGGTVQYIVTFGGILYDA